MKNLFIFEHDVVVSAENEKKLASRMILEIYFYESFNVFLHRQGEGKDWKMKEKFNLCEMMTPKMRHFSDIKRKVEWNGAIGNIIISTWRLFVFSSDKWTSRGEARSEKVMIRWLPASFSPALNIIKQNETFSLSLRFSFKPLRRLKFGH